MSNTFSPEALLVIEALARRIADLEQDVARLRLIAQRDHGRAESLSEALRAANHQVARLRQDYAELAGTTEGGGQ